MIEIKNLLKQFGETRAVDIDNYVINQGDMLGLVGNNGAGKTTLFRLILDLLQADKGNVTIDGIDVSKSEDWKKTTGEFIDDGFLIDYLTPEEYFYFIGKVYGLSKQEIDERLKPFEHFMNGEVIGQKKYIRNYSAGNKQKVGIISAMIHHPQLLILDEPFNFLDPTSQSIIKQLLKKYHEEHNATVIISSHNLNHTVDICSRIALMEHGKIIRDLVNENNSAEQELENYFNAKIEEEVTTEEVPIHAEEEAASIADDAAPEEAPAVVEETATGEEETPTAVEETATQD
ncbi:MAG: ABC transporter ATP-binding protein [Bacteroidaceae bacterium]|nr:ABC transporter ATP-binding protein [Bacteroidaceae bacterium]